TATTANSYTLGQFWYKNSFNAGGTASGTNSNGLVYGINPQMILNQGASWFTLISGGEVDMHVEGTSQTVTVGGTATAGDVITLTFTSSAITGSPVSVTATASSTDTVAILENKLLAAIESNTALLAAGIGATGDLSS